MPRPTKNQSDSIERIIDFLGLRASTVIKWLLGLIPTLCVFGFFVGRLWANMENDKQIILRELGHQKALHEENEKGREKARAEMKQQSDEAKFLLDILEKAHKK